MKLHINFMRLDYIDFFIDLREKVNKFTIGYFKEAGWFEYKLEVIHNLKDNTFQWFAYNEDEFVRVNCAPGEEYYLSDDKYMKIKAGILKYEDDMFVRKDEIMEVTV